MTERREIRMCDSSYGGFSGFVTSLVLCLKDAKAPNGTVKVLVSYRESLMSPVSFGFGVKDSRTPRSPSCG